jgi:hypothetical protein
MNDSKTQKQIDLPLFEPGTLTGTLAGTKPKGGRGE